MICLTLVENTIEKNHKIFLENRDFIDMVELRLDMLTDPFLFPPEQVRSEFDVPVIITCRLPEDGGQYRGSDSLRRELLYQFSKAGFDYIDLEMDTSYPEVEGVVSRGNTRIIRSYHNFKGIPDNFEEIMRRLASRRGEIPKAALFLRDSCEVLSFFNILDKIQYIDEKIVLGMGDFGIPTRILYKRFGSVLSYCSVQGSSGAPGQLTPGKMRELYRADRIDNSTLIYGIAGNPVMHSGSPDLHNTGYIRSSMNAVYIPFLVDNMDCFFKLAGFLPIKGFSVTVPHKVDVLDHIEKTSPEVLKINSCNTILRNKNVWEGYNTDMDGFLAPLLLMDDLTDSLESAAVIGAGGAARAVIAALQSLNIKISIFNRSESRGTGLAAETGCSYFPLERIDLLTDYDLIVQTTSVGMVPDVDKTPVPGYRFHKGQLAYDIIYTPLKTKFLEDAESDGAGIIGGMDMLISQGILQYEIFTDQKYPRGEQKESF